DRSAQTSRLPTGPHGSAPSGLHAAGVAAPALVARAAPAALRRKWGCDGRLRRPVASSPPVTAVPSGGFRLAAPPFPRPGGPAGLPTPATSRAGLRIRLRAGGRCRGPQGSLELAVLGHERLPGAAASRPPGSREDAETVCAS